jgi:hypothetical protein
MVDGLQGCTCKTIIVNNTRMDRDASYYDKGVNCHDCAIANVPGNVHHWGCDIERCPSCKGQLLSCDCNVDFEWDGVE